MDVKLLYTVGGTPRELLLRKQKVRIGRRRDCEVCIPAALVSREHCRIIRDKDTLIVKDLGSANGTFVNGTSIDEQVLRHGDRLQVGPVTFEVRYGTEAPASQPGDAIPVGVEAGDAIPVEVDAGDAIPVEVDAGDAIPVEVDAGDAIAVDVEAGDAVPVDVEAGDAVPVDAGPVEEASPVDAQPVEEVAVVEAVSVDPQTPDAEASEAAPIPLDDGDVPASTPPAGAAPEGSAKLDEPEDLVIPVPMAGSNIFDEDESPPGDLLATDMQPTRVGPGKGATSGDAPPAPSGPAPKAPAPPPPSPAPAPAQPEAEQTEQAPPPETPPVAEDVPALPEDAGDAQPEGEEMDAELTDFLSQMRTDDGVPTAFEASLDDDAEPSEDPPKHK